MIGKGGVGSLLFVGCFYTASSSFFPTVLFWVLLLSYEVLCSKGMLRNCMSLVPNGLQWAIFFPGICGERLRKIKCLVILFMFSHCSFLDAVVQYCFVLLF